MYREWLRTAEGEDPADEFVIMCGIVGLGQLLSGGRSGRIEQELQGMPAMSAGAYARRSPSACSGWAKPT